MICRDRTLEHSFREWPQVLGMTVSMPRNEPQPLCKSKIPLEMHILIFLNRIFVPCRDGVSHNPSEYCNLEDCGNGAQVLLGSILRYDRLRAGLVVWIVIRLNLWPASFWLSHWKLETGNVFSDRKTKYVDEFVWYIASASLSSPIYPFTSILRITKHPTDRTEPGKFQHLCIDISFHCAISRHLDSPRWSFHRSTQLFGHKDL